MGAGPMPEVGRGVQLQRAIFVSYCQKEGGGKPAFKINLTPMECEHKFTRESPRRERISSRGRGFFRVT
jgi:hypothetical protein